MTRIGIVAKKYERRLSSRLPEGVPLNVVLPQIYEAIEKFWIDYEDTGSRYSVELLGGKLLLTPRSHKPMVSKKNPRRNVGAGQPERIAVRSFIKALVLIYSRATGTPLGRNNIEVLTGDHPQYKAKHIPFLVMCMEAAGWGKIREDNMKYPSRIIQEVLAELHRG